MKANRTKLIVLGATISLFTGFNAYLWNIICSTKITFETQMNNGDPVYILPLSIGIISVYIALFLLIIISLILTAAVIFIIISLYKTSCSNSLNYYLIFSLLAFQIILSLYMVINLYSIRIKSNKFFTRKQ